MSDRTLRIVATPGLAQGRVTVRRRAGAAAALAAAAAATACAAGSGTRGGANGSPAPGEAASAEPDSAGPHGASPGPRAGAPSAAAREPSSDEKLAAIQKAMNELDEAAQQCWAVAATERFDIAGEVALQVEIAAPSGAAAPAATATVVRDTARNPRLSACLVQLMAAYRWAPPLHGQAIQLPFRFRAPDSQNTIDRALVAWNGQGQVSVAVLLDAANTGSDAASMLELAIAAGATTGLRRADRAELWYFLGAGQVAWPGGGSRAVAAGDLLYVPRGAARQVSAGAADVHAVIVMTPGGREGAARGGALPTPDAGSGAGDRGARDARTSPRLVPAASVPAGGGGQAAAQPTPDRAFAAAILALPAGGALAEHVHGEAELLYILAGGGTLTVNGVELPVTPTSVVQIPKHTRHVFVATTAVRAVQIFVPAGQALP